MNPFKVKCPECGARLKYANVRDQSKAIVIAALLILGIGYAVSLLIRPPLNGIFLIWVTVGWCVYSFYLVYKKAAFLEAPTAEEDEKA